MSVSYKYDPFVFLEFQRAGRTWGISQRFDSFTFTDHAEEMDTVEFAVEDIRFTLIDHPDLKDDGGTTLRFKWGFLDMPSEEHFAVIRKIKPSFMQGAPLMLSITAYDVSYRITGHVVQKVWQRPEGYTESELAELIAKKYGFTPVVEPTVHRKLRWPQGTLSDIEFLEQLTKTAKSASGRLGAYKVFLKKHELHFEPVTLDTQPIMEYTFYWDREGELLEFLPDTSPQQASGKASESKKTGVNPRSGEVSKAKANKSVTLRPVLGTETAMVNAVTGEDVLSGDPDAQGYVEPATELSAGCPMTDEQGTIDTSIEKEFKDAELDQATATARVIGNPFLKAKKLIKINRVGARYSGLWYIKTVTHSIGSGGYICDLELQRNAITNTGGGSDPEGVKNTATNTVPPVDPPKQTTTTVKVAEPPVKISAVSGEEVPK